MRSSIIIGAVFAALAIATPIHKAKKDIVWDITTEIVYVTVTEGQPLPTTSAIATTSSTTPKVHKAHSHTKSSSTSVYVAPPAPTTSSTPPPPPPPATTSTSTTQAPAPVVETYAPVAVESSSPAAKAVAATTYAAAAASTPTDYASTALYHHNLHRANHTCGALSWDDTLAKYSEATAKTCVFAHDMTQGGGGYGQNLAAFGTTSDLSKYDLSTLVADAITNQWYYGEAANVPYGQDSPNVNGPEFLHFTALVWKASTKVGCATVKCPAGSIFSYASLYTVCDYSTEGNVLGAFASNVPKPIGTAPISASIS